MLSMENELFDLLRHPFFDVKKNGKGTGIPRVFPKGTGLCLPLRCMDIQHQSAQMCQFFKCPIPAMKVKVKKLKSHFSIIG